MIGLGVIGLALGCVAPALPPGNGDLWSRLDHDRFVEMLSAPELARTLEALEASEPSSEPVERLRRELARVRQAWRAEPRDPEAARAAALESVRIRDEMLDAADPNEPLRGRWLADQAETILLWIVPGTGDDLAIRFGTPTEAQRLAADRWTTMANAAAAEALVQQRRAVDALLASEPDRDLGPEARALLARLRADYGRLTVLGGLALGATADLASGLTDRVERHREAIEQLESDRFVVSPDLDERARLQRGLSHLALREYEAADRELAALVADAAATARTRFEARAALVLATCDREGLDAGLRRLTLLRRDEIGLSSPWAFRLAWADLEHRLVRERQEAAGERGPEILVRALEPWIVLLETADPAERDTMLPHLEERILRAGGTIDSALPSAPPILLLARADGVDPASAKTLIETALSRSALGSASRLLALRTSARSAIAAGRWMDAIDALVTLSTDHPGDPVAAAAIASAVELSLALAEQRPGNESAAALVRETLASAARSHPTHPDRDLWRIEQAQLEASGGHADDALATLSTIRPDSPQALNAGVISLEVATRAAENAEGREVARWIDRAEQWLRRLEPWKPAPEPGIDAAAYRRLGIRVALARARLHLLADRPAAALVEVATIRGEGGLTREQAVESVRIRLAAFDRLGRSEDAAAELQRLGEQGDSESGALLESRLEAALDSARLAELAGDEQRSRRIGQEVAAPLAEALLSWLEAQDQLASGRRILLCAEGLRRGGRPTTALAALDRLGGSFENVREHVLERAECLYEIGSLEELARAMNLYRRLGAASPPQSPMWWLAELRQLQILRRVGRELDRIGPRIGRLRELNGDFGGEGLRRQFEALLLGLPPGGP